MKTVSKNPNLKIKKVRDCAIPSIGLGTYGLSGIEGQRVIREAIEMGYRHIDTAQHYDNEEEVGEAIRETGIPRKDLFVTNKVWLNKLEPHKLRLSVNKSLQKLQLDYVDLMLIHWPPNEDQLLRDALRELFALKKEGKVKWMGVSNFNQKLMKVALSSEEIICNQIEYHPFLNQDEMLTMADLHDFLVIAYSPLAQGDIEDSALLNEIGSKYRKTSAQVALRWLIQQRRVIAIPRSESLDHLKSNLNIFDFELSSIEMEHITSLTTANQRLVDPDFAPKW